MRRLSDISARRLSRSTVLAALVGAAAPIQVERPIAPFLTYPKGPPSFFVTSRGIDGGNLGGLAGADAHCEKLAAASGLKARSWRAHPTRVRSSAMSIFNWGRIVSMTAPLVTGQMAASFGLQSAMLLGAVGFGLGAVVWFALPETVERRART